MTTKIGTIEIDEAEEGLTGKKRPSRQISGGRGPGGSNGNNGGGGGNNGGGGDRSQRSDGDVQSRDKSRILSGFVLLVVLMTFGGLIGAYVVVATNRALEWKPFDLPIQVWISTIIILASSVTYAFSERAIRRKDLENTRRFLIATTVLGGVFIASQLLAWLALVNRGLYMQGNPYAGFFYILTAAHALHVIGGIVALGAVLLRNWYPTEREEEFRYRCNLARSVGWYWHFMGGLWVVLFVMLGFWK